jgi:hypothetical protein
MHSASVVPEHDLFIQQMKLKNTLRELMGQEMITHFDELKTASEENKIMPKCS